MLTEWKKSNFYKGTHRSVIPEEDISRRLRSRWKGHFNIRTSYGKPNDECIYLEGPCKFFHASSYSGSSLIIKKSVSTNESQNLEFSKFVTKKDTKSEYKIRVSHKIIGIVDVLTLFIRKIPRSKSGSAISYHIKISVDPLNLPRQFLGQYLKKSQDRFLRHNLQPTGPTSLAIFHYCRQEKRSLLLASSGHFSHNGCVSVAS